MYCKWGAGAIKSNYLSFMWPPDIDILYETGNLNWYGDCPTATEGTSWGSIKALYR
jgi:hypothetical protein